jgi:hypothetical protein
MSDGIDLAAAEAALQNDLPDSYGEPLVEANETMGEDNLDVTSEVTEPESFTGFDPNILPEDMQAVYKSMQADYTRKTQEIAELRRNYEAFSDAGVDADSALQAVGFLQQLNSDPEFALQIAEQIRQTVGTTDDSQRVEDSTPDSYEGLPPSLAKELEEMRAFREEIITMQAQQESLAELEAMENTIRTSNPDYSDDDMDAIYSLAYATDGDLIAAQQQYHAIQQRMLSSYMKAKTVPHGATPAPNAPSSVPNRSFGNLDEAHKAAMEALRNIS